MRMYNFKLNILLPKKLSRSIFNVLLQRTLKTSSILDDEVRVRFAPSPTGQLHIGGFRTALYNYLFTRSNNNSGKFILRIEDTDQTRLVPGAAEQLENLLEWAGIPPDESPEKGGPCGPYRQSERLDIYRNAIQQLLNSGHAYHCFCTEKRLELLKKEAARTRTNNKYDGRCSHLTKDEVNEKLSKGLPCTIRFKVRKNEGLDGVDEEIDNTYFKDLVYGDVSQPSVFETEGDPILIKSDGYPVYHFANVVDDHHMGITHVLRGVEWLVSTPKHLALYSAFGWKPPSYLHLPLMLNSDGTKLSKRNQNGKNNMVHVEQFRGNGYYANTLVNFLTLTGGGFRDKDFTEDRIYALKELCNRFDHSLLKTNSSKIEYERLETLNRNSLLEKIANYNNQYVQVSNHQVNSSEDIITEAKLHIESVRNNRKTDFDESTLLATLKWLVSEGRINKLSELSSAKDLHFLWFEPEACEAYGKNVNCTILNEVISALEEWRSNNELSYSSLSNKVRSVAKNHKKDGLKVAELMAGIRLALSGVREGPPVGEMLEQLGPEKAICRLKKAASDLHNQ